MNLKVASLIAFVIAASGAVYLYLTGCIFSTNPVEIAIQALAVILMIWARFTFGIRSFNATANATKGGLVTNGPYRFFRHPIYASIIYFFIGSLIAFPTNKVMVAFFLISSGLFVRMLLEERFLTITYPRYEAYCKKTKRIIPFIF